MDTVNAVENKITKEVNLRKYPKMPRERRKIIKN